MTRSAAVCLLSFLAFLLSQTGSAQDTTFLFTTKVFQPYFSSFLGNGYLSIATSPTGTHGEQSYLAGVYDEGKGDIPRIACLPDWNEMDVFDGSRWLNAIPHDSLSLRNFSQTLDMYDATLSSAFRWVSEKNTIHVGVQEFVSYNERDCAVVRLTIRPESAGRLSVSFPLEAWPPPVRMKLAELDSVYYGPPGGWPVVWYPGHMTSTSCGLGIDGSSALLWLVSESDGRKTRVAQAISATWPTNLHRLSVDTTHSETGVKVVVTFDASAGKSYTFTKYIAVSSGPGGEALREEAIRRSSDAPRRGFDVLLREHTSAWHHLWETDIRIVGRPDLQRVVHSMIFYLLCSVREGTDLGIPPMGLSTAGYYGHIFWDSDTWMFPPLLLMHPEIARSIVMFRGRTLEAARRNATRNGYRGAMYPWEADELGNETTPKFAHQNASFENHIVGDVALAQWQYFLATRDTNWLGQFGFSVLKETADFWLSRVTYDTLRDQYDIRNAVSVNEGLIGIPNDTYTNGTALRNLQLAVRASEVLNRPPDPRWRIIASKLVIPYDSLYQFHPVYEGASPSLGSAGSSLSYPLGFPIDDRVKQNDLDCDLRLLAREGPGAMMGVTLLPLAAAELGDQGLLDSLVAGSYLPFLRPPFNVLSETPRNVSVNFLTGAGGFLQQVIFGYTGLRLTERGFVRVFKPVLPRGASRVLLQKFSIKGKKYDIDVTPDTTIFRPR
jgi:trehalose/maltose hydrolase-like predicted phosphorylase